VLKPQGIIETEDFAFREDVTQNSASVDAQNQMTQEPDKSALENAMREHQGVIARVARQFGMSRQALYRRLNKFGIDY
jgi:transcriptional regulator of acetoin/glycerol metabolism